MNILSLFNGVSCGRIAMERAGIDVNKYYSSEVDNYALQVDDVNYSDNIQVGDIRLLHANNFDDVDIIIGGSSCQNFSSAGDKKGMVTSDNEGILSLGQYMQLKEKGTEFHGYSHLFWEYIRLLKEIRPKYFLLENVKMAQKWKDVITNTLIEIYPDTKVIEINSNLVSAHNRKRNYWSNIPNMTQPKDKGIFLKDIIEDAVEDKYFLSEKLINGFLNSKSAFKDRFKPIYDGNSKSYCLTARYFKMGKTDPYILDKLIRTPQPMFVLRKETDKLLEYGIRKLTPIECERLQTLPDNWTSAVSNTQRYKTLGNGWTVDVLAHIFRNIK